VHRQSLSYKMEELTPDTQTPPIYSLMESERYPMPSGWTKEFDQTSGQSFYVRSYSTACRSTRC